MARFLRFQAEAAIVVADLFTVELLNGMRVYCLAVIEHGTCQVRILGAIVNPTAGWVT